MMIVYTMCSVGAFHDGDSNECSSDDQFVMANISQPLTESNFNNPFRFSHCSVRYFKQYISTINA